MWLLWRGGMLFWRAIVERGSVRVLCGLSAFHRMVDEPFFGHCAICNPLILFHGWMNVFNIHWSFFSLFFRGEGRGGVLMIRLKIGSCGGRHYSSSSHSLYTSVSSSSSSSISTASSSSTANAYFKLMGQKGASMTRFPTHITLGSTEHATLPPEMSVYAQCHQWNEYHERDHRDRRTHRLLPRKMCEDRFGRIWLPIDYGRVPKITKRQDRSTMPQLRYMIYDHTSDSYRQCTCTFTPPSPSHSIISFLGFTVDNHDSNDCTSTKSTSHEVLDGKEEKREEDEEEEQKEVRQQLCDMWVVWMHDMDELVHLTRMPIPELSAATNEHHLNLPFHSGLTFILDHESIASLTLDPKTHTLYFSTQTKVYAIAASFISSLSSTSASMSVIVGESKWLLIAGKQPEEGSSASSSSSSGASDSVSTYKFVDIVDMSWSSSLGGL